jgi:hypothetical protein
VSTDPYVQTRSCPVRRSIAKNNCQHDPYVQMLPKNPVLGSFVTLDCSLLSFVICGSPFPGNPMLLKTPVL